MPEKKNNKIEEILKKLAENSSKANSQNSSNTNGGFQTFDDRIGDPECPKCGGLGYIHQDLPVGHPEFGKLQFCDCRKGQIAERVKKRLFELSHLDELSHLTFENFEPRGRIGLWPMQAQSLEQAFNTAQHFARTLKGWLLLQGPYGCGKTHLAAAIANFAVEMGVPTLFITVPDLLDSLRIAYQDPTTTFEERFEQIRGAELLIMDDFGTQNATPWAQEKLFQIINYRYINKLPLVVTTNLHLEEIEERIRSRLEDPELVTSIHITATDYRKPVTDIGYHKLSSLDLHHNHTFGKFSLREDEDLSPAEVHSLQVAFQAARDFAENPRGWLVIMGYYSTGKTHLAAAIANFRADTQIPPLFVGVPDLLDHLRATFNPTSTVSLDRRFEEVRTAPLLILDDLGAQSPTPWVREKLYQLFNYRYHAELPTVITTSASLDEMDARLRSRMLDQRLCRIVAITAAPFTGGKPKNKKAKR